MRFARHIAAVLACCAAGASVPLQAQGNAEPLERLIDPQQIDRLLRSEAAPPLRRDEIHSAMHYCGCSDQPQPHFPYALLVVFTPRGDVLLRTEGNDGAIRIRALAVRHGSRYCPVDPQEACYGEFAEPCAFTDHAYGPTLAKYFPNCKTASERSVGSPSSGGAVGR